jgi:hypothetical protein
LASIKLKRAKPALFAPPVRSKASSLFQTGRNRQRLSGHDRSMDGQPRSLDVEKSYGQKAALAVGALR